MGWDGMLGSWAGVTVGVYVRSGWGLVAKGGDCVL